MDAQVCAPGVQLPAWQLSPLVQVLPSSQLVPLPLAGFEQAPLLGSQVPAEWHWSCAVQVTAVPAQDPPWQLSASVQALPSSQAVPLAFAGFEHTPLPGSQAPAAWH